VPKNTTLKNKKMISIFNQINKLYRHQFIFEFIFVYIGWWVYNSVAYLNVGYFEPIPIIFTIFYIFLLINIVSIKIEIGYKYEKLKELDLEEFPNSFLSLYLVGIIFSIGIYLVPLLDQLPSWIFYHEMILRKLIICILLSSIILPIPYFQIRKFMEKNSNNNANLQSCPLKPSNLLVILYFIYKFCYALFLNYYVNYGSYNEQLYSFFIFLNVGFMLFAILIRFLISDLNNQIILFLFNQKK
jgi:hypothetical protein